MRVQEAVKAGKLSTSALSVHALPAPTQGIAGLLEAAKDRVRLAEKDGEIADHATKAIAHLQAIKEKLVAKYEDHGTAQREADRLAFESHRQAELDRLAEFGRKSQQGGG
jgi:hypothetical protein